MDVRKLRDCLGRFATGVAIVTTTGVRGQPVAITVNSFSSVSLEPPLVLWSLDRRSSAMAAFAQSAGFAIHVLSSAQQDLSSRFAQRGVDKFADFPLQRHERGYPLLSEAHALIVCERHAMSEVGDHMLLIGRVVDLMVTEEGSPLIFYRGNYHHLTA